MLLGRTSSRASRIAARSLLQGGVVHTMAINTNLVGARLARDHLRSRCQAPP
ncbi:hypothetical protein C4K37_3949 [Pseudomonas chlororaphis subsp. piscium]|nr:hypothetical protein C4K37_3949 [Pseudomonas chlororaphis subsp. piscium]AZC44882.1 hypothetical protein C4K36_3960 [Pseudomonas chlororaphis subsp. piscium]